MRDVLSRSTILAALFAGSLAVPGASLAAWQAATPGPFPQAPEPAACTVDARPLAALLAVLDTAPATPAAATPVASGEQGVPADAATTEGVQATLYQVFACANAGDLLRVAGLYTDRFLVEFFGGAHRADLEAFLALPPQPLPQEQRRIIRGIGDVVLLPDGRARVVIILDEPDDPRTEEPDTVFLREADGRWLVDEIQEDAGAGA